MIVQRVFAANQVNSRDIGISILSDEDQYKLNYAIGIWNGTGTNLTRQGTAVSQYLPNTATNAFNGNARTYNYDTRVLTGEMMYTARVLYKISGNPGYGLGDILNSRTPQAASWLRLASGIAPANERAERALELAGRDVAHVRQSGNGQRGSRRDCARASVHTGARSARSCAPGDPARAGGERAVPGRDDARRD